MQKTYFSIVFLLVSLILVNCTSSNFDNFVTRKADKVYDGEKEVRFLSFNIPNLHYNEDYLPFESVNPWRLPDEFEIRDALKAIKQIGGKVARIYVPSLRKNGEPKEFVRHIEAPGKFNEDAFLVLDKVMQVANEEGVRIIIPFVDNWIWWGGPMDYAAFRGKDKSAFWSDPEIIADFKKTIDYMINRKNFYTGVQYKDDKALFCWETGNELEAPAEWTKHIAAYIKSLDANHLLLEGTHIQKLRDEAIEDPNLDILSTHYSSVNTLISNQKLAKGKKPYLLGEFGLRPLNQIKELADTVINQGLLGGMIWSLRNRNRDGGFYHHAEHSNFESYRFPGFANGEMYSESELFNLIKEKTAKIGNEKIMPVVIPEAPKILEINDISAISWQGSVGAKSYTLERKEEYASDWVPRGDNIDESKYQYRPLFNDETAEIGKRYFYRLRAKNEAGISDFSNIAGPIAVASKKLIDEYENLDRVIEKSGELQLLTMENIRKAKEDRSRLTGKSESFISYKLPNGSSEIKVEGFLAANESDIKVFISEDGTDYSELNLEKQVFEFSKNEYGFYPAARYTAKIDNENAKFVKIVLLGDVQLSRTEISYSK
ncbi:MAG: hypothetical protein WCZ90_08265 [Melioribacteraceae bacterium]